MNENRKTNKHEKLSFEPAEIDLIVFEINADIICTSGPETPGDDFE